MSSDRAKVRLDTVDAFCAEQGIEHIDLLKTDTEGYETSVLRGANSMFEQGRIDFDLAECDFPSPTPGTCMETSLRSTRCSTRMGSASSASTTVGSTNVGGCGRGVVR